MGGFSSGSSSANLNPEQAKQVELQNQLLGSLVPAYQGVISGAGQALDMSKQNILDTAKTGQATATTVGKALTTGGLEGLLSSKNTLENIISPDYEKNQLAAAIQPIQEQTRELRNQQNSQFGGSGNLGSARFALADTNLASLDKQRQSQAVAGAIANITGQKIGAAQGLGTVAGQAIQGGADANQAALKYASAPQNAYQQFANTIFSVPGSASTANFSGTQGQSSKGFKI